MSFAITVSINGSGVVHVLRNGSTLGDVYRSGVAGSNSPQTFSFDAGDTFTFQADQTGTPTFVNFTGTGGTTTANPFTGTVNSGGSITANFSDGGSNLSKLLPLVVGAGILLLIVSAMSNGGSRSRSRAYDPRPRRRRYYR